VIYGITATFAAIDWVMSLQPLWYSTIFPPLYAATQILSGLAFSIAALLWLADRAPLTRTILPEERRDLGNLLLAFVMVWAYMSFSQYLIIWSENLPEETTWYFNRLRLGWEWVALALILLQFAVPFLLLLARKNKEKAASLVRISLLVAVMCVVNMYWWIEAAYPDPVGFYWLLDLAAVAAIGGIWTWCFIRQLGRASLLPTGDPYLPDYLPEVTT
jgi:Ni/Fe-hydrogenase subunit HybB-like protein